MKYMKAHVTVAWIRVSGTRSPAIAAEFHRWAHAR